MDNKEYLTNKAFCPIPWTGLMYNFNGDVKTCIRSSATIGNIKDADIQDILINGLNVDTKTKMLGQQPGLRCQPCYDLEVNKNSFDIISDRVFYLKELKEIDKSLYNDTTKFELHKIDVRWSNLCNFGCIYCNDEFSSRIASEWKTVHQLPSVEQRLKFKNYIFENVKQLKHVYLAGGEPLLMKENLELLELLKQHNPDVNIRVNTNLSKVDTKIFNLICEFANVHWIISLDEIEDEYEYVRYGSSWQDFLDNLEIIKKLPHKLSFNMLHFVLNYNSIFDCVEYLQQCGFHNNSFIIGPLLTPIELNIRHLPESELSKIQSKMIKLLDNKPGYLLEDSIKNMLQYTQIPFEKDLSQSAKFLADIDQRRGTNSKAIFKEFYNLLEKQNVNETI